MQQHNATNSPATDAKDNPPECTCNPQATCAACKKKKNRESSRKYYAANREKLRESARKYREDNREKALESVRKWREDNREKVRKYIRGYRKAKCKNPAYKLNNATRTAVHHCLNKNNVRKTSRTFEALGYTVEELKTHLERQFKRGMTWDNYGSVWHIDHIQPLSSFNFTSMGDSEFKAAWCLSNLRPCLAKENLSKGAKQVFLL